jgi:hypothetical protein
LERDERVWTEDMVVVMGSMGDGDGKEEGRIE